MVHPLCFTFSRRLVGPASYALASSLGDQALVAALDELLPRLQTIGRKPPHGKINPLLAATFSKRARRSRSGRAVRSRRSP
jgi:hypothetical protein